ncbi:terminase small subunit [Bacillus cereus]|uniref:terminase small subunit n=1 Tax=Bacillus cereus TaxID=1396 RepID=UPI001E439E1C|nr:terminase small subunit [Bacillus cereus]MCD2337378.1 terminase small subunit [Bacillus cereus]
MSRSHDLVQPFEDKDIQIVARSSSESDNQRQTMVSIPIELTTRVPVKHQALIHAYIKHGMNLTKSAEEVGYAVSSAHKIMNKPESRAYFTAVMNRDSFYDIMSFNEVLATLSTIARAGDTDEILNVKTGEIHEVKIPSNVRVKSLESLAKYHKILFNGPNDLTLVNNQKIVVDIEDTTKEVLAKEGKFNLESDREVRDGKEIIDICIED